MNLDHLSGDDISSAGGRYPSLGSGSSHPVHTVTPLYTVRRASSFNRFAEVILRRKNLAMGVFLAALIVAFLWTVLVTPTYRASATIEIEKDSGASLSQILASVSPSIASGIESVANEDVLTEMTIIKSKIFAERLADRLKLNEAPEFCAPPFIEKTRKLLSGMMPAGLIVSAQESSSADATARDRLIQEVMDRIRVIRDGRSRLMTVMIESESPELAQKMLETYLDIYFTENLAKRRRANMQAGLWLVDEVKKAEKKARLALDAVVDFAATYDMVSFDVDSPTSRANHKLAMFSKTAEDLVKTKEARILLESLYSVSGQDLLALPTELKSTQLETLESRLADLEATYAEASKIYSESYPKLTLLKNQITFLKDQSARTQREIMSTMVASARQKEDLHEKALDQAKSEALKSNSLGVQYAILKKTADTSQEIYMLLLKKFKDVQLVTQAVGNNLLTVDPPSVPVKPVKPRKVLNMLLGSMIGIFMAIAAAFLADAVDSTVKSIEDVENLDVPNLGSIPDARRCVKRTRLRGGEPIESLMAKRHSVPAVTEAIECIKTSLLLSFPQSSYGSLLVTSAISGEGRTFVSMALACAFSSETSPVLLIEADMRRPRLHRIFGHNELPQFGLSDILSGSSFSPKRTIQRSGIPGLLYITSGSLPKYPTRLFEASRLKKVISLFKQYFSRIVIDAPPLIGLSDARILTNVADGTILVVKRGYSSPELVQRALLSLNFTNGARKNILGTVLNSVEPILLPGRMRQTY